MDRTSKKAKNVQSHRILEVKTSQTGAFKHVIERMSTVISDCCFVFIPSNKAQKEDDEYYEEVNIKKSKNKKSKNIESDTPSKKPANPGGIRVIRLSEDRTVLIKLKLDSENFDVFECEEQKMTIGIDINILHAYLKTINDDEPITLYINSNNRSSLFIHSQTKNNDNSEETDIEIYLIDISNPDLPISQTEFQNKITIASDKFHNICKHFNNNATFMDIRSFDNEISFKGNNDSGKLSKSYKDIHNNKKNNNPVIVQGVYELKNLLAFSKCNKLCTTIDIYLKNDFPLVLVLTVGLLGKMYVFLTPKEDDVK